jgi:hypothetical protein
MMAIATIRLKLTMMDARLRVERPTFSRSCATAVSSTTRRVRGARLRHFTVRMGTSSTAPNNSAAMAA